MDNVKSVLLLSCAALVAARGSNAQPTIPTAPAQYGLPDECLGVSPLPWSAKALVAANPVSCLSDSPLAPRDVGGGKDFSAMRAQARRLAHYLRQHEAARLGAPKGSVYNGPCHGVEWNGGTYGGHCYHFKPHGRGTYSRYDGVFFKGTWREGVFEKGSVTIPESPPGDLRNDGSFWEGVFDRAVLPATFPSDLSADMIGDAPAALYKTGNGVRVNRFSSTKETGDFVCGRLKFGTRSVNGRTVQVENFLVNPAPYVGETQNEVPHGAGQLKDGDGRLEYVLSGAFKKGVFKDGGVSLRNIYFHEGYDYVGYYGSGDPRVVSAKYGDWLVHGFGHRVFRNGSIEDGGFIHGRLMSGLRRVGGDYHVVSNYRVVATIPLYGGELPASYSELLQYVAIGSLAIATTFGFAMARRLQTRNTELAVRNMDFQGRHRLLLELIRGLEDELAQVQPVPPQAPQLPVPPQVVMPQNRSLNPGENLLEGAVMFRDRLLEVPEQVDVPAHFICPITHELMVDPVIAFDGHTYERVALLNWINRAADLRSPVSNVPMLPDFLCNFALRHAISDFIFAHPLPAETADATAT